MAKFPLTIGLLLVLQALAILACPAHWKSWKDHSPAANSDDDSGGNSNGNGIGNDNGDSDGDGDGDGNGQNGEQSDGGLDDGNEGGDQGDDNDGNEGGDQGGSEGGNNDLTTGPFYISVFNPNVQTFAAEFLTTSGDTVPTIDSAGLFGITNYGGLSTADEENVTVYLSAPDDTDSLLWQMSPSLQTIYTGFDLANTDYGDVLTWSNEAFDDGVARFCQQGSSIWVVLRGDTPDDCDLINLLAFPGQENANVTENENGDGDGDQDEAE